MPYTLITILANTSTEFTAAEWQTRVNLAACYRLVSHYGMTDLVYNHITARIPGSDTGNGDHLLINGYGFLYDEITASNLVKIDIDGNTLHNPNAGGALNYGINAAGYVIHRAVHAARHDVQCVIHVHTRASMAVSAMECGLLPITQTAMRFKDIAYHDYEGVAIDLEERQRLVADLGQSSEMILRNHGLLVTGASVAQAFNSLYWLEMACKAQVDAMAANTPLRTPPPDVLEKTNHLYKPHVRRPHGEMEWPAMLRLLDKKDPGYKT